MIKFLIISIFFSLNLLKICIADDVFKWTDKDGNIHFSNKNNNEQAEKAKLPEIEKLKIEDRINEFKSISNKTCINKGGVNCEIGPDSDGSVVCFDGSKDSSETYKSLCSEVKLEANLTSISNKPHKKLSYLPITIIVRNNSGIKAQNIKVEVTLLKTLNIDTRERLILEGPTEIAPFGIAEFTYTGRTFDERILRKANILTSCKNCWNPTIPKTLTVSP